MVQMKRPSNKAMAVILQRYRKEQQADAAVAAKEGTTNMPTTDQNRDTSLVIKSYVNAIAWPLDELSRSGELLSHDPSSSSSRKTKKKKTQQQEEENGSVIVKDYKKVEPPAPLLRENKILNSMLATTLLLASQEAASPNKAGQCTNEYPRSGTTRSCIYSDPRQPQKEIAYYSGTRDNLEPTSIPSSSSSAHCYFPNDLLTLPPTIVGGGGEGNDHLDMDDIQQEIINTFSSFWRKSEEE